MATTWVSQNAIGRVVGKGRKGAAAVARSGAVRSRLLPGMRRREYALEDALKIVAEAEGGHRPPGGAPAVTATPEPGGEDGR